MEGEPFPRPLEGVVDVVGVRRRHPYLGEEFSLGPLDIDIFGILIALGVWVAATVTTRRFVRWGDAELANEAILGFGARQRPAESRSSPGAEHQGACTNGRSSGFPMRWVGSLRYPPPDQEAWRRDM